MEGHPRGICSVLRARTRAHWYRGAASWCKSMHQPTCSVSSSAAVRAPRVRVILPPGVKRRRRRGAEAGRPHYGRHQHDAVWRVLLERQLHRGTAAVTGHLPARGFCDTPPPHPTTPSWPDRNPRPRICAVERSCVMSRSYLDAWTSVWGTYSAVRHSDMDNLPDGVELACMPGSSMHICCTSHYATRAVTTRCAVDRDCARVRG